MKEPTHLPGWPFTRKTFEKQIDELEERIEEERQTNNERLKKNLKETITALEQLPETKETNHYIGRIWYTSNRYGEQIREALKPYTQQGLSFIEEETSIIVQANKPIPIQLLEELETTAQTASNEKTRFAPVIPLKGLEYLSIHDSEESVAIPADIEDPIQREIYTIIGRNPGINRVLIPKMLSEKYQETHAADLSRKIRDLELTRFIEGFGRKGREHYRLGER